jgi:spermidine/putrescine transport system permease protein
LTARLRKVGLPYLLLLPGLGWLAIFFAVPLGYMLFESLKQGTIDTGFVFNWEFSNYTNAISDFSEQFLRSFEYAGLATLFALLIGYPLAYVIAFRGGRWRNALLLAVIVPFFVTYLIRTLSWETILLPLYASLERIDHSLLEAGYDLYGRRRDVFLRVTLPLSMPGVVAGTLLTFIPAAGDFINAELLGTPNQSMIGNVIQSRYLELADYPTAAALSFILMALMLTIVLIWARIAGTEALLGTEGGEPR